MAPSEWDPELCEKASFYTYMICHTCRIDLYEMQAKRPRRERMNARARARLFLSFLELDRVSIVGRVVVVAVTVSSIINEKLFRWVVACD